MSGTRDKTTGSALLQEIMTALRSCYGDLDNPDFRTASAALNSGPHRSLIKTLLSTGIAITETTDANDDVSTQLIAAQAGDRVAVELSVVGPFAILRSPDCDGHSRWVTRPDQAHTPLETTVANALHRTGLRLLDRGTAMLTINMRRSSGEAEATLYQGNCSPTSSIKTYCHING